jgi:molybdopterin synthase sulfur carrier subunit
MNIEIKLFGIAKEIVNSSSLTIELSSASTVKELRNKLMSKYPRFGDLKSIMVAVNSEYAKDDLELTVSDEVALIPPVSGG